MVRRLAGQQHSSACSPPCPCLRVLSLFCSTSLTPSLFARSLLSAMQAGPWPASYHPKGFYRGARSAVGGGGVAAGGGGGSFLPCPLAVPG